MENREWGIGNWESKRQKPGGYRFVRPDLQGAGGFGDAVALDDSRLSHSRFPTPHSRLLDSPFPIPYSRPQ